MNERKSLAENYHVFSYDIILSNISNSLYILDRKSNYCNTVPLQKIRMIKTLTYFATWFTHKTVNHSDDYKRDEHMKKRKVRAWHRLLHSNSRAFFVTWRRLARAAVRTDLPLKLDLRQNVGKRFSNHHAWKQLIHDRTKQGKIILFNQRNYKH